MIQFDKKYPYDLVNMPMPCSYRPIEKGCRITIAFPITKLCPNGKSILMLNCIIEWPTGETEERVLPLTFFCTSAKTIDGKFISAQGYVPDFIRKFRPTVEEFISIFKVVCVDEVTTVKVQMPNGAIVSRIICDLSEIR